MAEERTGPFGFIRMPAKDEQQEPVSAKDITDTGARAQITELEGRINTVASDVDILDERLVTNEAKTDIVDADMGKVFERVNEATIQVNELTATVAENDKLLNNMGVAVATATVRGKKGDEKGYNVAQASGKYRDILNNDLNTLQYTATGQDQYLMAYLNHVRDYLAYMKMMIDAVDANNPLP